MTDEEEDYYASRAEGCLWVMAALVLVWTIIMVVLFALL